MDRKPLPFARLGRVALPLALLLCALDATFLWQALPPPAHAAPATYTVNATTDTGAGSGTTGDLRYAITQANTNPGSTIDFSLTSGVVSTVTLSAALPPITAPVTIDGSSNPGYAGSPLVTIDGAGAYEPFFVGGGGPVTLNALTIVNGRGTSLGGAPTAGGGIYNHAELTLSNSTVTQSAAAVGGGIFNDISGRLAVSGSTISDNTATGNTEYGGGGGIANAGWLDLLNVTVAGNTASVRGGGLFNTNYYTDLNTASIRYSTLANNSAPAGANVWNVAFWGGELTASGTIVALPQGGGTSCGGEMVDAGHNVANDASCALPVASNASINLVSILNLGPPQVLTFNLPSAAYEAGGTSANGCPSTDERGSTRATHASLCDIGAYEHP